MHLERSNGFGCNPMDDQSRVEDKTKKQKMLEYFIKLTTLFTSKKRLK
jgi:hypothetical protein